AEIERPLIAAQLAARRGGVESGTTGLDAALEAHLALNQLDLRLIDAQAAYAQALARLDALTETP
ncbi:hypothetical protein KJ940_17120, partial [Myxococcota bacterium]|nr:hypothetical protein [Myxococcota bacterium]